VAFIRRKRVHGYEYFQVVRNYRDANGKHRQEMLCHLGTHNSLEAAIAAEQTQIKIHRETAELHRKKGKDYIDASWLLASRADRRVNKHETKLRRYLRVQREYF
jgi:hypothetical protein